MLLSVALLVLAGRSAAQAPVPVQTLSVSPCCAGACSTPRAVEVDETRVVVLWAGEDDTWWALSVDARRPEAVGATTQLGKLSVGRSALERGLTSVVLPGGDLALLGALRDGRISFARGSAQPERRVASRAILPDAGRVLSLAAAPFNDGIALLVLRARAGSGGRPAPSMDVAVHWLDAKGAVSAPELHLATAVGDDARLAVCGGQVFAAWSNPKGVVIREVGGAGVAQGKELLFAQAQRLRALSPLLCDGAAPVLLASFYRPGFSTDSAPELSLARPSTKAGKPSWKKVKLPGTPKIELGMSGRLAAQPQPGGVQLQLVRDGQGQSVALDLATAALATGSITHVASDNCVALQGRERALCVRAEAEPKANGCWSAKPVQINFYGAAFSNSDKSGPKCAETFWAKPQLEAPERLSPTEQAEADARVRCGDPAFQPLRSALDAWCKAEDGKPAGERYEHHAAFCGKGPSALQAQLAACSDSPECPGARGASIPSVSRSELTEGNHVELKTRNCSVWLARRPSGEFQVTDRECVADL